MTARQGRSRDGLWTWTPTGIERGHVSDNPLRRECPHCGAGIGMHCTNAGRATDGYHPSRRAPEDTDA